MSLAHSAVEGNASEHWVFLHDDDGGELYYNIISGETRTETPGGGETALDLTAHSKDLVRRRPRKRRGRSLKVPERCSDYVVDHAKLVRHHGSYFQSRLLVDESVNSQRDARTVKAERRLAAAQEVEKNMNQLSISATAGPPTVNSVVQRTQWQPGVMKHLYSGEVGDVLRLSLHKGDFTMNGCGLERFPSVLSNTLTLQMGTLRQLRLSRNKLSSLPPSAPKYLRGLVELDLRSNRLTTLPDSIRLMTGLRLLRLEYNRISSLPGTLPDLVCLTDLLLTENWLERLPGNIGQCPRLTTLELANNRIDALPHSLPDLGTLTKLNLSNNNLVSLAVPPAHETVHMQSEAERDAWEEIVDASGEVTYFNGLTGESSNTRPSHMPLPEGAPRDPEMEMLRRIDAFAVGELTKARKRELRGVLQVDLDVSKAEDQHGLAVLHNHRRRVLAILDVAEWETSIDEVQNRVYYQNHVACMRQWDMPEELDTFGGMTALKSLNLSYNTLRELPSSMQYMHWLERFECADNHLERLPDNIGNCHSLRNLNLATNEIKAIPDSFTGLTALRKLDFRTNCISEIPWAFCTALSSLTHLFFTFNQITRLPNSFRFMTKLTEFQIANNPLEFPPMSSVNKGIEHVLWDCRDDFLRRLRGEPPEVTIHKYGTADECRLPLPAFEKELQAAYLRSERTESLELAWKELYRIPPEICGLTELRTLKLIGNKFREAPVTIGSLVKLETLTLSACQITEITEDFGHLVHLTHLSLEDNLLEQLPMHTTRLTRLRRLNVSNNRLKSLPEHVGRLTQVEELLANVNLLSALPPSIGQLQSLRQLSLGSNRLEDLPDTFEQLGALTALNLNQNNLEFLSDSFANLPSLAELRIGYNSLERFNDSFGNSMTFATSLVKLWAFNNRLQECPQNIVKLTSLTDLRLDNNPMISPPPDLLPEGTTAIMRYCRIRASRFDEMTVRLQNVGFEVDVDHFSPVANNALVGNTGYLTAEDLHSFDTSLDTYLNGAFYLHGQTGSEISSGVVALRAKRLHNFQIRVLNELQQLVEEEVQTRSRFSEAVIDEYCVRPWGENGVDVNTYAIATDVMTTEPTKPNEFVKEERPSILSELFKRLPQDSRFDYDADAVEHAIHTFRGPYGRVAEITEEPMEFQGCECVDPGTNMSLRHIPCMKRAVVIQKVIYTQEEADRKQREEDLVFRLVERVKHEVGSWLITSVGRKRLKQETKRRQRMLKRTIRARRRYAAACQAHVKATVQDTNTTHSRQGLFRRKQVFPMHQFDGEEEMMDNVVACNTGLKANAERLDAAEKSLAKALARKSFSWVQALAESVTDLENKYVGIAFKRFLNETRLKARSRGQRRPWDGEDGADYIEFCKKQELLEEQEAEGEAEGLEDEPDGEKKQEQDDNEEDESGRGSDGHLSWNGVSDVMFSGKAEETPAPKPALTKLLAKMG